MEAQAQQRRILVVDDEPHIQEAISLLAAWGGFPAQGVSSAKEALALLEKESFDLVITDNRMPGMSGAELAAAVKARWPSLPVVMFTAYPPAKPLPAIDLLLIKPTDGLILVQSLKKLLHRPG
jgi:CheY-like chemotaxis protein